MKMAMQWEKVDADKTEAPFKFKLAPNKSPTQPKMEERLPRNEMGPMAMSFYENVGWVAEIMGPISKHWKRLAREIKSDAPKKKTNPTKLTREGLIPLIELDPNALELKCRRGKTNNMLSQNMKARWLAVRQWLQGSTAEPNDSFSLELPGLRVKPSGSNSHRRGESNSPNVGLFSRNKGWHQSNKRCST